MTAPDQKYVQLPAMPEALVQALIACVDQTVRAQGLQAAATAVQLFDVLQAAKPAPLPAAEAAALPADPSEA